MEAALERITSIITQFGFKLIAAIAIFAVGFWLAGVLRNYLNRAMANAQVDMTLRAFASNLSYTVFLVVVALTALGQLGVQTTSFIAILGAAGLAIGLALQGSLSNFAAGVLMILFRPFGVGDYIEGAGTAGTVEDIQIFTTTLISPDNRVIIIPNAKLSGDNIVNYSAKSMRRIDRVFGVGYTDDIDRVKSIMAEVLAGDERILKDPAPTIGLLELADSSLNFAVRPWVMTADYWDVFFDLNERMKKRLDQEGISIPYPQQDVHLHHVSTNGAQVELS